MSREIIKPCLWEPARNWQCTQDDFRKIKNYVKIIKITKIKKAYQCAQKTEINLVFQSCTKTAFMRIFPNVLFKYSRILPI
ncbi:hypothetical protein PUN28_010172 [Cardiocondyla obscurior]|uniref:Uncharacterized protein n=1 Tax=Cardiocondyla obscurior TaxID=286306 RepID=A0AAW2FQU0_9HYME